MSLNSARIALFTHLKENWTQTPIVFGENDPAGDLYMKEGTPFLYVYISWGDEIMKSLIGSNKAIYQTIGILAFRLYTKTEDGDAIVDKLSDDLFAVWRSKKIDNITME